jgi:hypothetical protein
MALNPICRKCVKDLLEGEYGQDSDVTVPCVAYRNESWHWDRMVEECPLMDIVMEKIIDDISPEAQEEIKRLRKS